MIRSSIVAFVLSAIIVGVAGCGGAFGKALGRGDSAAAALDWDRAALAYEQATQLEPEDEEARAKLRWARQHQVDDRLVLARRYVASGDPIAALAPLSEAVRLDPSRNDARELYAWTQQAVLDRADADLRMGALRDARAKATAVLNFAPDHAAAMAMRARAERAIAERALTRAAEFERVGHWGNAAIALADALSVGSTPDVQDRFITSRAAALRQTMFYAVVADIQSAVGHEDLAGAIRVDRLAETLSHPALEVVGKVPSDAEALASGIRLGGAVDGYHHERSVRTASRQCQYVCERRQVKNPDYDFARGETERLEREVQQAQTQLAQATAEVTRLSVKVNGFTQQRDSADHGLADAEDRLEKCRNRRGRGDHKMRESGADCDAVQRQRDEAARKLDTANAQLTGPTSELARAEADMEAEKRHVERLLAELSNARLQLDRTPISIEEVKHCNHSYRVATHTHRATANLRLAANDLHGNTVVLPERELLLSVVSTDQTFPAQAGVCEEVARGNALELPSESELRRRLAQQGLQEVAQAIRQRYEAARAGSWARAVAAQAAGDHALAVEAFVAYVLTGPTLAETQDPNVDAALIQIASLTDVPVEAVRRLRSIEVRPNADTPVRAGR